MTRIYGWNPMPHQVDVRCPECGGRAQFEFAEAELIRLKKDVEAFKKSPHFEYRRGRGGGGGFVNLAFYYHGLHGREVGTLPEGYQLSDWAHSKYLVRSQADIGTIVCHGCGLRRKHALKWPQEAWWVVSYRGRTLWAFDREWAVELKRYVESERREPFKSRFSFFLLKVPTHFLKAKARKTVAARLQKLLEGCAP